MLCHQSYQFLSSEVFSWPLIPSIYFFISDIFVFISRNLNFFVYIYFHISNLFSLSTSLLNMQNIVLITVFVALSTNFDIYIIFSSLSIDFSPAPLHVYIFYWIVDIVNFTLLDIPINILEFCSGILSYLETIWSFRILFLSLVKQSEATFSLMLILPQNWSKTLLSILHIVSHELWHFPLWLVIIGTVLRPLWAIEIAPSNPSRWLFFWLHVIFSYAYNNQYSIEDSVVEEEVGCSSDIWISLSVQLPLLRYSALWILATLASLNLQLGSSNHKNNEASPRFFLPLHSPETLSRQ